MSPKRDELGFSVIIPTYNREGDLTHCVESIAKQNQLPRELIIIDDGNLSKSVLDALNKLCRNQHIDLLYREKDHSKEQKGTSTSRNIGMSLASEVIVFILDDDLILEPGFFQKIMAVWEGNTDNKIAGVGGVITNNRRKSWLERAYNRLFGLVGEKAWDVNDVAFQIWDDHVPTAMRGYYVHGGVCAYRKDVAQKLGFTIFGEGRMALEDVDFCLRAKRAGYFFIVEPGACTFHAGSKREREKDFSAGVREGHNRRTIFRKNCQQDVSHRLRFHWANVGWCLRPLLVGRPTLSLGLFWGSYATV